MRLSLAGRLTLAYCLRVWPGDYAIRLKGASLGQAPALLLGWEGFAKDEHSSLFGPFLINEGIKFYNIGTWIQCYKTFSFVADDEAK